MIQRVRRARRLSGEIIVPSDKSLTHRAVMFSALARGTSVIHNPLPAADCLSTASCMRALGVAVTTVGDRWTVEGRGLWGFRKPSAPLNCGNSGTTMRLVSGILAAQPFESTLTGDASLSSRPMGRVAEPLRAMGIDIALANDKHAPMRIAGRKDLQPIHWKSKLASAQVKSCVLLAGLHARGETSFEEPFVSRDHTERMLAACGVPMKRQGGRVTISGPSELTPQEWHVPGDISSAAFFMVAGALVPGARLTLRSVNMNPTRTGVVDVLLQAGAAVRMENERVSGGEPMADLIIDRQPPLKAFSIDATIAPRLIDEVPVLAVAASQATGTSIFTGLEELRVKETDRLAAVAKNLREMGGQVDERPDGLVIHGPTPLKGAALSSFDDHRIAMAFAVAGLVADGETAIEGAEAVVISFPAFWETLAALTAS